MKSNISMLFLAALSFSGFLPAASLQPVKVQRYVPLLHVFHAGFNAYGDSAQSLVIVDVAEVLNSSRSYQFDRKNRLIVDFENSRNKYSISETIEIPGRKKPVAIELSGVSIWGVGEKVE